jgi:ubiquinone/menaquinone biosynthesis C-methylase UbiE
MGLGGADPSPPAARYDGFAWWYDEHLAAPFRAAGDEALERLPGAGAGRCLDLCCGTGTHLEALCALGWRVTGVDISVDQLRIARQRAAGLPVELVQGDAERLPFDDELFDAVVSMFSHTDVDDFSAVLREAARVLRPEGVLVYVGLHPCFVGSHSVHPHQACRRSTPATARVAAAGRGRASRLTGCGRRRPVCTSRWGAWCRRSSMRRLPWSGLRNTATTTTRAG